MPPSSAARASPHRRLCSVQVALCTSLAIAFCWLRNTRVLPSGEKRGEKALPRPPVRDTDRSRAAPASPAGCGHATARKLQGRLKQ